jgi:hypothetical protein
MSKTSKNKENKQEVKKPHKRHDHGDPRPIKLYPGTSKKPSTLDEWIKDLQILLSSEFGRIAQFMTRRDDDGKPIYPERHTAIRPTVQAQPTTGVATRQAGSVADTNPFSAQNDPDGLIKAEFLDDLKSCNQLNRQDDLNKPKMFAIMMDKVRMSLESENLLKLDDVEWEAIRIAEDPVLLLNRVLETHSVVGQETDATGKKAKKNAKSIYQNIAQEANETIVHYRQRFESALKAYDTLGLTRPDEESEQVLDFIGGLDDNKYFDFKTQMDNDLTMGAATYPKTVSAASTLAANWNPGAGRGPQRNAMFAVVEQKGQKKKKEKSSNNGQKSKKQDGDTETKRTYDRPCPLNCGEYHPAYKCPHLSAAQEAIKEASVQADKKKKNFSLSREVLKHSISVERSIFSVESKKS